MTSVRDLFLARYTLMKLRCQVVKGPFDLQDLLAAALGPSPAPHRPSIIEMLSTHHASKMRREVRPLNSADNMEAVSPIVARLTGT